MRIAVAYFICLFIHPVLFAQTDSISPGKYDSTLIVELRANFYPSSPKDYDEARDSMFTWLDVDATDSLTCVYSGLRAKNDSTRTPSNGSLSFNTEHTWPQSFYDEEEPMRGDIHHLYPTWSSPNQSRSNHPFAEINDNLTTSWWFWENGGSVSIKPTTDIDLYSEYYNDTFEPREDHKGNAARAIFYFWTMYQTNTHIVNDTQDNDAFFEGMKNTLYQWHRDDPVDSNEVNRSLEIESVQGNKNPFIHDTTLVRRAYFQTGPLSSDSIPDVYISEVYEANGGTVKYVELFNYSDNSIDLSAGGYQLHRFSNANTSSSSISLTGTVASKAFFIVGDDNSGSGVQTVFGEGNVDQNNSSINHNGNDKYVLIRSSSDTLDSFSKDNIGNSSSFASNQVAYRIFSALPNDGGFGQTTVSSDGDTVSSGNWRVFEITTSNANGVLVGTPGFNSGIEANLKPQAKIQGNTGWRMISIPGNNSTIEQISDDTAIQGIDDSFNANVFKYDSSGSYNSPENLNSTLSNGEGLLVYFFDNENNGSSNLPIVLDTSLDEPSGSVTVPLNTKTAIGNSYFTLVGNPFQSNIDLNELSSDQALQSNIHLLNDGLYEAVSMTTAKIKPWQAFWVESSTVNAASEITFPQSAKTDLAASESYFAKFNNQDSRITISLKSSETLDQGCEIAFNRSHSIDWDVHDATKLDPNRDKYAILSCKFHTGNQSIVSLPMDLDQTLLIPLEISSIGVEKEHSILWEMDERLELEYTFTLIDTEINNRIILSNNGILNFDYESSQRKLNHFSTAVATNLKNVSSQRFELLIRKKGSDMGFDHPEIFKLKQNYPNPFNPTTTLEYVIPQDANISLAIYSITGELVETLFQNEFRTKGEYSVTWDASNFASGIYYAKLNLGDFNQVIRMMLIK